MIKIIYFSKKGENFVDGQIQQLETGNTEMLAQKINREIKGELVEIMPITDYPNDYYQTISISEKEKNENLLPEYQTNPIEFSMSQIIFVGFPNWHGSMPNVVKHFLSQQDLSNVTIYPFCTHEGSGFGTSLIELNQICSDSIIETGLPVRGSRVKKADKAIKNWLSEFNLGGGF